MSIPAAGTLGATAGEVLTRIRAAHAAREAADAELMELALAWAELHAECEEPGRGGGPVVETDPDEEWCGLPRVRWHAAASFAAAQHLSTRAGTALLRDVLTLRHRLPRVWSRVATGEVPAWRGRRIAQGVLGQPDDVATYVDQQTAHRAGSVGVVTLDRIIDEARLRLHAEERELDQLEALDARYVRLDTGSINHTGVADLHVRGDWADLAAFDDTVRDIATRLAHDGCTESLDVRRSMAVGVLADPVRAAALLDPTTTGASPATRPARVLISLHLSEANLLGLDPVVNDTDLRAHLDQVVRAWCGRDDVTLETRPVVRVRDTTSRGCSGAHTRRQHDPTTQQRAEVTERDPHCVFPYCARSAAGCDLDHVIAFDPTHPDRGPTCPCNLAPLCRHHHRQKTHAGWRYAMVESGVYLWADPHGQQFVRNADGTHDVSAGAPVESPELERLAPATMSV